jgi:hypothetical protein
MFNLNDDDIEKVHQTLSNMYVANLIKVSLGVCTARNVPHKKYVATDKLRRRYGYGKAIKEEDDMKKETEENNEEENNGPITKEKLLDKKSLRQIIEDKEKIHKRKSLPKSKGKSIDYDKSMTDLIDEIEENLAEIKRRLRSLV